MGRTHPNLVGHWRAENNPNDTSGNGLHGVWAGTPAYAKGKIGQAFDFNTLRHITVSNLDNFGSSITGDFSISVWVKTTSVTSLFSGVINDGNNTSLYVSIASTLPRFDVRGDGNQDNRVRANIAVNDGDWHHIVYVKAGSKAEDFRIYVDGKLTSLIIDSSEEITAASDFEYPFLLGARNNRGTINASTCELDDVQIWNRALAPHQIAAIYNGVDPAFIGDVA